MKFAINYSPQAEQLLNEGRIQVDIFKCPSWKELVPNVHDKYGAYVHYGLLAGSGTVQEEDLDEIEFFLKSTHTEAVNMHVAVREQDFAPDEDITQEKVVEKIAYDVNWLGRRFGNENIIIEHIPYPDPGWTDGLLPQAVDPDVITQVIAETGCGLLMDVAHGIRACEGLGVDRKTYLSSLPVHALRELHIVGILPDVDENGVRQDHFAMTEDDWSMAEWAIEQINAGKWASPSILAFEYGGVGELFEYRSDLKTISEQAPRLYQLAKSVALSE